MADEQVAASPEPTSAPLDTHKRKLDDLELNNASEPPPHHVSDLLSEINGAQQQQPHEDKEEEKEGNECTDESDAKRQRRETNGDNGSENEPVQRNGHQDDEKEDNPKPDEAEQPRPADDNAKSVEVQETLKEGVEVSNKELASDENYNVGIGSGVEPCKPNEAVEKPSEEIPREGDVPVPSIERHTGSGTQLLSRKIEVPNDKVGVLIGKAGDTIRSLQDNSGAKIQIMRDADADPRSATRPLELVGTLESINKAEKLIKDVIAEADAGGSPSLVARGFSTVQAASGGEQLELKVPIEKVGLIIGKGGETIRNLQTRSGARIQLIQQNPAADGEQTRERTVRVTGIGAQIEAAREMIQDVMNQTARPSPLSGGYNQQSYRPRGPSGPQWGPRGPHHAQFSGYDYPQRGPFPSPNSQYPPLPYGNYPPSQGQRSNFGPSWEQRPPPSYHGPSPQGNYNYGQQHGPEYGHPPPPYSQASAQPYGHSYEVKYDHHPSSQHFGPMGSQPAPYAHGAPHYGPQDPYGNKPPLYGMPPQPQVQAPHHQPYGQPRPNQPGEMPYQGQGSSAQVYGRNMASQQPYPPYASSGVMQQQQQQSYPSYGTALGTEAYGGHTAAAAAPGYGPQGGQPVVGYGQSATQQPPLYPQTGGYGSYPPTQPGYAEQPTTADNAGYGYQTDPAYGTAQAAAAAAAYPSAAPGQGGYAQSSQTQQQPTYEQQAASYGTVPGGGAAPTGYGKSASPQPPVAAAATAYPQYDSSQVYGGGHR
ncbi:uncharacterized protein LOC127257086 isoform X2 [Andrographis paniculata]|uniref:uncharacterized protein LOC127257086 isoform X2 n=1 Tax=Andrographis paniculata TaxID=175694 RepID=UPI0021E865C8|nr:uncharacterized protein LOC127257086 isoform X2 [Andrographis paniculata]